MGESAENHKILSEASQITSIFKASFIYIKGKESSFRFLSVAIASFANFVPEIVELLGNRPKYAGSYEVRFV